MESGLLDLLEPGDAVMADKGFDRNLEIFRLFRRFRNLVRFQSKWQTANPSGFDIRYDLIQIGVKLNIPPFAKKNVQMPPKDVVSTRQIASLRIHVERAIRLIKQYRILGETMPLTVVKLSNDIWGICSALTLFHPPLVVD